MISLPTISASPNVICFLSLKLNLFIMYSPYSLLIWSRPFEPTVIIFKFFPSFKIFLKLFFANLQIFELNPPHSPLSAVNTTHK